MILCLDIGNTHIHAGLFVDGDIKLQFRYPSSMACTSDTLGLFLRNVLRENKFDPEQVTGISLCSVVPFLDYSVNAACRKYFSITPIELKPDTKIKLKIQIENPHELGADRIANAIAAIAHFPEKNIIIVDFGTATTLCAINKDKTYLGGAILPGFKLSMEALSQKTAKLSAVDIVRVTDALGKSTQTNIQSGLYFGQLGAVKEIIQQLQTHIFSQQQALIVATGGYSHLLLEENIFDHNLPNLVLEGLYLLWKQHQ